MKMVTRILRTAVPVLLASGISASAATLDFTSDAFAANTTPTGFDGSFSFTGSTSVVTYTLDGSPDAAQVGDNTAGSALDDLNAVGLLGNFDGVGIKDDEIGDAETVTLTFSRQVKLTGAFFLDLFVAQNHSQLETAAITSDLGQTLLFDAYNVNDGTPAGNGGFGGFDFQMKGTSFSFFEFSGNDDIGIGDFALAGLTVAPVPLPAGLLLLGTALGGLGLSRRRRKHS